MKFNFDWSLRSILKIFGGIVLGIAALALILSLGIFAYKMVDRGVSQIAYDDGYFDNSAGLVADSDYARMESKESSPSYIMPPYDPQVPTGGNLEEFEVKNYSGTIRTGDLNGACDQIAVLKERKDVIFENSDKSRDYCYFRFKVEKEKEAEIVALIESMKPDYFNANTRSIKGGVEGVENELEILNKKLASIEETLASAQKAYDEVTALATAQKDINTLATIINSKLELIQRLSQEQMYTKESIDRYTQNKSGQLDQLNYTFFDVHVQKVVVADWKNLKESWQNGARTMVESVNTALQGITLHLLTYLAIAVQVILYVLLAAFLLKWVWRAIKWMWRGEFKMSSKR